MLHKDHSPVTPDPGLSSKSVQSESETSWLIIKICVFLDLQIALYTITYFSWYY